MTSARGGVACVSLSLLHLKYVYQHRPLRFAVNVKVESFHQSDMSERTIAIAMRQNMKDGIYLSCERDTFSKSCRQYSWQPPGLVNIRVCSHATSGHYKENCMSTIMGRCNDVQLK